MNFTLKRNYIENYNWLFKISLDLDSFTLSISSTSNFSPRWPTIFTPSQLCPTTLQISSLDAWKSNRCSMFLYRQKLKKMAGLYGHLISWIFMLLSSFSNHSKDECCKAIFTVIHQLKWTNKKFESLKIQLKRTAAFESWGFNVFSNVDESSRDITYEWTKSYGWKTRPKREYSLLGRKTLRIGSPAKNIHQAWWILA